MTENTAELFNTTGFYKLESEVIYYGRNFVYSQDYELLRDTKDNFTYPVDGWYWFDSEEEAYTSFGLELPIIQDAAI